MIKAKSGEFWVVRFQDGERLPGALLDLGLRSAVILGAVGMLRDLVLAYWDGTKYIEEPVSEPVELLSFLGNIGDTDEGEIIAHVHLVGGKRGGAAVGGHLLSATVHNTMELVLRELPGVRLHRKREPSGLFGLYPEETG
jgi:predicted DNA-binding protein with PD1-like motif